MLYLLGHTASLPREEVVKGLLLSRSTKPALIPSPASSLPAEHAALEGVCSPTAAQGGKERT